MVKEEILEGLKMAIAKGEPLRKAMMSFYNAGYPKEDIEESARALQIPQIPQTQTKPVQQPLQTPTQPKQVYQKIPAPVQIPVVQRVSGYGEKPSRLSTIMIFVLVFFLLFLFGVLVAVFLFKEELSQFFNNVL